MPTRSWTFAILSLAFASPSPAQDPGADADRGQRLFAAHCARCHGYNGAGGTGPALNRPRLRRAADDKALTELIQSGVPGTEMPGTWQLGDRDVRNVVAYVRKLGRAEPTPLPGDPAKGEAIYARGDCSKCHAVKGQGGVLGPDLTGVGSRRGAAHLRQVLLQPASSKIEDAAGFLTYLTVRAATHDGRDVRGLRVNEDSFSILLRDENNRLHSFEKSDLAELKREPDVSLMPDSAKALSPTELDDLVAYLSGLQGER
jgi:putative heme-binding domain-containing protein